MRNNHFSIIGLVVAVFVFTASGSLFAQSQTKSDTISITDSDKSYRYVQDFGPLAIGDTSCRTIYLKNASNGTLVIKSLVNNNNPHFPMVFTFRAIPSLPVLLLKDEIVSIADLCFSPVDPTTAETEGGFAISYNFAGNKDSNMHIIVRATGKQLIDTMLQKPCVTASWDANLFGPIIIDGDVSQTLILQSNRYDTLYVSDTLYNIVATKSLSPFIISGITFPYPLAPQETKTFTITYSPRSNTPIVEYRHVRELLLYADTSMNMNTYCAKLNFDLLGVAIEPTADSISTSLAAGSTDVLAMVSDNSVTTKTFHFKNNTSGNLKVTNVAMKNGKSYSITDIQPTNTLPFTLAAGESMSVTVAMTTVSNGVYYDELIITAENAVMSMNFQLQGLRKNGTQASVKSSTQKHLLLYPNPTSGSITLELPSARSTEIQVVDVLGNVIAKATATKSWTWDGNAPSGMYILQATGIDDNGKPFHAEEHFVIRK